MADDKGKGKGKDKGKDKKEGGGEKIHPATPIITILVIAFVLEEIVRRLAIYSGSHRGIAGFFGNLWSFLQGELSFVQLINSADSPLLSGFVFVLRLLSFGLSALFLWLIFSTNRKYTDVMDKLKAPLKPPKEINYDIAAPEKPINPRWNKVLAHINSANSSDWKLAILEADIMLNDMLDKVGYHGETMADKLKSVEASDFNSLQDAWEAHKVRNVIAHEGTSFEINKPEAERVIKLFKKVFEEFKYI